MKHLVIAAVFFGCLVSGFTQQTIYTQTVKGVITDEQSGNIIKGVTVTVDGIKPPIQAISDSLGNFKLKQVPIGRQTLRISCLGFEDAIVQNLELTSSREVVVEIKLKEKIKTLDAVTVVSSKNKYRAINESAVVSARQLSIDEAVRYSGTRSDPSRMAQNFAGVSGTNDARNDIVIRGNSPSGVLWRMDGIDIPNPNHFNTLGATGGPVTMLNTNTLKNSDFITSAFPAQYGNAVAGVFDLRLRNGDNEKYEYLGQMGFNGFELGAEGPLEKGSQSSFLVNYRYSMVATVQALGMNVGTGSATPYYQDACFKLHIVTKKSGTFDWFGLGGESHITFPPDSTNNFYVSNNGSLSNQVAKSLTGVTGVTHTYFFDPNTSGKLTLAVSGIKTSYTEELIRKNLPNQLSNAISDRQTKLSAGYTLNKKFSSRNQLTAGILADISFLNLNQQYIPNGDSILQTLIQTSKTTSLVKAFVNYAHRFSNIVSSNIGVYAQRLSLNGSWSIEPRWNLRYQFTSNQSLSFGAGLHSQMQPLEVYFYQTPDATGQMQLTNKNLDFVRSIHTVAGYDISLPNHIRIKTEVYGQFLFHAAIDNFSSSFSMLNYGADFGFPTNTNLVNKGKGYNYGLEITVEKFLYHGFYYLFTGSLFQSRYKGSDQVWRNTAFDSKAVANFLAGKEFRISNRSSFGLDTKLTVAGGQPYTPFDVSASQSAGYVIYKTNEAYSVYNNTYLRWDLKLSYTSNGRKATQKWYIDFQNMTNRKNIYIRTLNPSTGQIGEVYQMGFFPNINYQVTF